MQLLVINSPAEVVEGESYLVRLTVTNQSTKAGIPVDVNLEIVISAATAWTTLIPVTSSMEAFAAGQTRTFDYTMNVPLGSGGESGQIIGLVRDPTGIEITRATESISIEAVEVEYTLAVSVAAPVVGYVIKSPDKAKYTAGESVTLTAYLDSWAIGSYVFDYWNINGAGRTGNPITIIMDSNKTVTAYFKEVAKYTLTTSVSPYGAGRVYKYPDRAEYDAGEIVEVYALSYAGYEFDHWGGDASGTYDTAYILMDRNRHVTAYFKEVAPEQYSLICVASPLGAGWFTKDPSKPLYDYGEVVKLTAHALYDYIFQYWDCDGEFLDTRNPINFMVTADHTLTAHFTR